MWVMQVTRRMRMVVNIVIVVVFKLGKLEENKAIVVVVVEFMQKMETVVS